MAHKLQPLGYHTPRVYRFAGLDRVVAPRQWWRGKFMGVDAGMWGEPIVPEEFFAPEALPLLPRQRASAPRQRERGEFRPAGEAPLAQAALAAVRTVLTQMRRPPQRYLRSLTRALDELPTASLARLVALLAAARQEGRRVVVLGEGQSISTASYFARDLRRQQIVASQPALSTTGPLRSDTGRPERAPRTSGRTLEKRLRGMVQAGDIVLVIGTSASAQPLLPLLRAARRTGATTVALVGCPADELGALADQTLAVPCASAEQARNAQIYIEYVVSAALEHLAPTYPAPAAPVLPRDTGRPVPLRPQPLV